MFEGMFGNLQAEVKGGLDKVGGINYQLGKLDTMNQILAYLNRRPDCADLEFRQFLIDMSNTSIEMGKATIPTGAK